MFRSSEDGLQYHFGGYLDQWISWDRESDDHLYRCGGAQGEWCTWRKLLLFPGRCGLQQPESDLHLPAWDLNPSFRVEVTRATKSHPDIGYATPSYQLEELIIKSLRTLRNSMPPCVVVLDALDECKETWTTSVILSSLSRHLDELFPSKFLVTSRPESHITSVFKSSDLNPFTRRYVLHEMELGIVPGDIKHYLSTKLTSTRELYHLEIEWPSGAVSKP